MRLDWIYTDGELGEYWRARHGPWSFLIEVFRDEMPTRLCFTAWLKVGRREFLHETEVETVGSAKKIAINLVRWEVKR